MSENTTSIPLGEICWSVTKPPLGCPSDLAFAWVVVLEPLLRSATAGRSEFASGKIFAAVVMKAWTSPWKDKLGLSDVPSPGSPDALREIISISDPDGGATGGTFTLEDINPSEVQSPYSIRDQRGKAFTRYLFENGIFLQGSSVYRYQHEIDGAVDENARDHVWLFNAGIGYRIRKRHGYLLCEVNNIFAQDVNLNQATYFNDPVFTDPRVQLVANFNF